MNRREFMSAAIAAGTVTGIAARQGQAQSVPPRPNIVFILADDLGYGDLSCYGRPDYTTPVLDNMAAEGMKFTDNYASAPVCTPTRCAYMTGRYPHRLPVGLQEPLGDRNTQIGIPPDHPTVGSLMKKAGYETALIGKWHLGNIPDFGPNRHGFDEFFGINGSGADYFSHYNTGGMPDLYENLTLSEQKGYLTDLFTDRAVQVIRRAHSKPFFLSLQYNAPHWPWEGPDDQALSRNNAFTAGGSNDTYALMVQSMDTGIGKVLEALRAANLERNTLVVFTSDNGGERYSYNWPFQFQKMYLWEGGLRVPAIVRWPGVVPSGRVTNQVALSMDWSATFLELAGTQADTQYPFDGESVWDVCRGSRPAFDRTVFWRLRAKAQAAARMGHWKYLRESGEDHLFDLANDPAEAVDLKDKETATFDKIRAEYKKWESTMLPVA
jgi:arylsulfatase A-like enzyme